MPPILSVKELTRTLLDGKPLVNSVSFDLHRGEIMTLSGRSGSGKSSLLRLINRLDEPSAGTVQIDGSDYRQLPVLQLRKRVGMVLQSATMFAGTVADNIRWGPALRGVTLTNAMVAEMLNRVDLGGYEDRVAQSLSGGEAQRVGLARALANEPEILLLDEPTSALDDQAKFDIEATLMRMFSTKEMTCICVTHDMRQAQRLGTRSALMEHGVLSEVLPFSSD